jgi:type VI secretion system secreted protein VgrG
MALAGRTRQGAAEDIIRTSSLPAPDSLGLCARGAGAPSGRGAGDGAAPPGAPGAPTPAPAFGAHLCHNSRAQEDAFSVYIDILGARGAAPDACGVSRGASGASGPSCAGAAAAAAPAGPADDNLSWFAVFDGHGGKEVAEFATTHLHRHFLSALAEAAPPSLPPSPWGPRPGRGASPPVGACAPLDGARRAAGQHARTASCGSASSALSSSCASERRGGGGGAGAGGDCGRAGAADADASGAETDDGSDAGALADPATAAANAAAAAAGHRGGPFAAAVAHAAAAAAGVGAARADAATLESPTAPETPPACGRSRSGGIDGGAAVGAGSGALPAAALAAARGPGALALPPPCRLAVAGSAGADAASVGAAGMSPAVSASLSRSCSSAAGVPAGAAAPRTPRARRHSLAYERRGDAIGRALRQAFIRTDRELLGTEVGELGGCLGGRWVCWGLERGLQVEDKAGGGRGAP